MNDQILPPEATQWAKGYQQRVIDHFRDGEPTQEDWILLSQIFFEISVLGGTNIGMPYSIADLNKRIKPPLFSKSVQGIMH